MIESNVLVGGFVPLMYHIAMGTLKIGSTFLQNSPKKGTFLNGFQSIQYIQIF